MSGPLAGIKVIDLSMLLPGPLCSMYLGDMGADVIKVENPRAYDGTRAMFKNKEGYSPLFMMINRNKKAITLNLKKEKGKEILFKLLKDADILLEGFRPDALDEMGIGYDELKERFPKLIYCGIYGYGASGPYKNYAGHDGNYMAMSGLLELTGEKGRFPASAGFQLADIGGGTLGALSSILAALYSREKTGRGQKIDISMMDGSLQFLSLYAGIYFAEGKMPDRGDGILSGKLPNYNVYKTKDEKFIFLGALEERFFRTFLRQLGLERILDEYPLIDENISVLKEKITEIFAGKTLSELDSLFSNPDCCLTPVRTFEDVLKDPQLRERGMVFEIEHPEYGKMTQFAAPFPFSETKCSYRLPPPSHGEHTNEILGNLGFSKEELEKFSVERVI